MSCIKNSDELEFAVFCCVHSQLPAYFTINLMAQFGIVLAHTIHLMTTVYHIVLDSANALSFSVIYSITDGGSPLNFFGRSNLPPKPLNDRASPLIEDWKALCFARIYMF